MAMSMLLASAASGCFARLFAHPLDTIRSRMMVSTSQNTTFATVTRHLLRTEGFIGLYRGFTVSVCFEAPAMATFLTSYHWSKDTIATHSTYSSNAPLVHLASGLFAETVSAVFWVPMEVVKQRAQIRSGPLSTASSITITRDLIIHEGPRALFKGYTLTIAVFGPYSMIYFLLYERFKLMSAHLLHQQNTNVLSIPIIATCAGFAGGFAAAFTSPLDVIKTRLQTQGDKQIANNRMIPLYSGSLHAARTILKTEGYKAFFRGISARVFWIIPSTAIAMSTFEFLKSHFNLSSSFST